MKGEALHLEGLNDAGLEHRDTQAGRTCVCVCFGQAALWQICAWAHSHQPQGAQPPLTPAFSHGRDRKSVV